MSVSGSSEELRGGLTDPLHSGSDGFVMPTAYVRRIHAANVGSCADADVSFATALKPPTGSRKELAAVLQASHVITATKVVVSLPTCQNGGQVHFI